MTHISEGQTSHRPTVAYFSMEIGLDPRMPTYSGGLGVLAGDTIRAAADLRVPMVAVTLLHRKGYLRQRLDAEGRQSEEPVTWPVAELLVEQPGRARVDVEGRAVAVRAWRLEVKGVTGAVVPVYFLDTDLPENGPYDRALTDHLYGGDERYRLCQEVVLGMGGVRMLRVLGQSAIARYHMNEGHAALLGLELLEEQAREAGREQVSHEDVEAVRAQCVFTTHTPVPAGHDQFPMKLVRQVLGVQHDQRMKGIDWRSVVYVNGRFNLTYLALSLSRYVNGVAKRHADVSRLMFTNYQVEAITNGVHAATWVAPAMAEVLDRHLREWRRDNFDLRYATGIPCDEIREAHRQAKRALLERVASLTGVRMEEDVFTLGFARRATAYKRATLLFHDTRRLVRIAERVGPIQIIYAGKAHPRDEEGKALIRRIIEIARTLGDRLKLVYLPDYDIELGKLVTAGVDVWLNTPRPPMEASGTSGMKAALNGVPSFSVLDGWWIEGAVEGVTGWSIGPAPDPPGAPTAQGRDDAADAADLYDKLERVILPRYHDNPAAFAEVMRHCIALNGSYFNTHRMVQQYVLEAYFR